MRTKADETDEAECTETMIQWMLLTFFAGGLAPPLFPGAATAFGADDAGAFGGALPSPAAAFGAPPLPTTTAFSQDSLICETQQTECRNLFPISSKEMLW